jgi:uncharacterized protein (TIRG00374 family)
LSRKTLLNVLKIAFAGGLVWFVIHQTGWDKIKTNLSRMDISDWALGLGAIFVAYCVSMLRWRMLLRSVGIQASFWDAFRLGFIGAFFNNVIPGLTGGDLIKAIYIAKEHPEQRADAVLTVVVDRVLGIVALALIAAVVIPFDLDSYREAAVGIYGFLFLAGLGGAAVLSRRIKARLRAVLIWLGRSEKSSDSSMLSRLDRAVSTYRARLDILFKALAMGVAVHLLIILSIWLFAGAIATGGIASLPVPADPAAVARYETLGSLSLMVHCSIVPIIMIISALPIAPAGWGVGEVAFQFFYEQAGTTGDLAVALSFAYRLTAILLSLVGLPFLLMDRKRVMSAASSGDSAHATE